MNVEEKEIRIQNVVASAAFNQVLDLDAIVKAFPRVEYRLAKNIHVQVEPMKVRSSIQHVLQGKSDFCERPKLAFP